MCPDMYLHFPLRISTPWHSMSSLNLQARSLACRCGGWRKWLWQLCPLNSTETSTLETRTYCSTPSPPPLLCTTFTPGLVVDLNVLHTSEELVSYSCHLQTVVMWSVIHRWGSLHWWARSQCHHYDPDGWLLGWSPQTVHWVSKPGVSQLHELL